ncbi:MAG TPA: TetR family transcriptional regulator [Solirubrobacteraceae bacterium]|nr:TetR family transcriptional regulator [Solirubrobacteraceae bacterium]
MTDPHLSSPGPGARRRGGRRPGNSPSRQKILEVARVAFPANGYSETSLRGIARDAGVDPSLIVQFFGSKAGLFAAVVEWPFDATQVASEIGEVPVGQVGEYTARIFIGHWDRDEHRNPIISLIHAALADPAAAAMFREFITSNLTLPVVERVGADRPQLRAALLASQLIGFGLSRYVLAFDALTSASSEELIAALGATLQNTCTGPLALPEVSP